MATEPSRRLLDNPRLLLSFTLCYQPWPNLTLPHRLPSLPPTSTLRSDPSRLRSRPLPTEVDATSFLLHCTPPLHGTRPPPIYDATFDPPQCTSVLSLARTCNTVPSIQCAFSTSSSTGMHLHRYISCCPVLCVWLIITPFPRISAFLTFLLAIRRLVWSGHLHSVFDTPRPRPQHLSTFQISFEPIVPVDSHSTNPLKRFRPV